MKLSFVKFSQSVRINGSEHLSFSSDQFDITLFSLPLEHGFVAVVEVKHKRTGESSVTTFANCPYFKLAENVKDEPSAKEEISKPARTRKARTSDQESIAG